MGGTLVVGVGSGFGLGFGVGETDPGSLLEGPPDAGLELGLGFPFPYPPYGPLPPMGELAGGGELDITGFGGVTDGGAGVVVVVVVEELGPPFEECGGLDKGVDVEPLGGVPSPEAGVRVGGGLARELEGGGIELELVFCGETSTGFPVPELQPGTRSAGVAAAGPLVTATQPGRYGRRPFGGATSSSGNGFGAEHEFMSASERKRPSFWNTEQSSITPELAVHVFTARESTSLSHPSAKSPCSPKPVGSPFASTSRPPSFSALNGATLNHIS